MTTWEIFHDDELVFHNFVEEDDSHFENNMIEWQDSFKTIPNDIFMHQIRSNTQENASNYTESVKIEIPVHQPQ
jgi:hypothetical protein